MIFKLHPNGGIIIDKAKLYIDKCSEVMRGFSIGTTIHSITFSYKYSFPVDNLFCKSVGLVQQFVGLLFLHSQGFVGPLARFAAIIRFSFRSLKGCIHDQPV